MEQNRLLATLLSNLDGMVYRGRVDEQWTLEFVSEGCQPLTGYLPQDFVANRTISWEKLTHPDDRARVRRVIESALMGRVRFELEYRIVRADGEARWVLERGSGVYSETDASVIGVEGIIQDNSRRKQMEMSLSEAERRYRTIFENAIEGIFQSTPDDGYVTVNPALARMYGYDSPAQLIAQLRDIDSQLYVQPERRLEFIRVLEAQDSVTGFEAEVRRRDGRIIWISENARAVRDANGQLMFFEGTVEDITERKRADNLVRHQATHDAVTGLPNRVRLQERFAEAQPSGGIQALVFIDLDQFKIVNDSLGHAAGDQLLQVVASRLQHCVRERDTVARLGGDEFVVLLGGPLDPVRVSQVAERLRDALMQPSTVGGRELTVTCSIGVALNADAKTDLHALMRSADLAMYRAKSMGRNNVQFFTPGMEGGSGAGHLDLLLKLQQAVERREFVLYYEPKYELAGGKLIGVEALIRWNSPDGLVSPGVFIPLAEESGLILPIGEWVLREACRQMRDWQSRGIPLVPVSVNLSRRQLERGDIATLVETVLRESGLDAGLLELEVTESALMGDGDSATKMLARLRDLGIRISMDDFGTAYSSLSYLQRFRVHCLKIDRSFLIDAPTNPDSAAIVRAIISLGHSLGLRVLAEGVETAAHHAFLQGTACDEYQGYFRARPMPAEAFEARLWSEQ